MSRGTCTVPIILFRWKSLDHNNNKKREKKWPVVFPFTVFIIPCQLWFNVTKPFQKDSIFLYGVYCPIREFFTHMETTALPVKVFKFWPTLGTYGHWSVRLLYRATATALSTVVYLFSYEKNNNIRIDALSTVRFYIISWIMQFNGQYTHLDARFT